jgi:hypothetical protein
LIFKVTFHQDRALQEMKIFDLLFLRKDIQFWFRFVNEEMQFSAQHICARFYFPVWHSSKTSTWTGWPTNIWTTVFEWTL